MRIVAAADLHLDATQVGGWDSEAGVHSNWVESFARLDDLVDTVNETDADLLVIAGDTFHHGRPQAEAVARAQDAFRRLRRAPVAITSGNHDQAGIIGKHRSPIEAYFQEQPWCYRASPEPEIVDFEGLALGMLPWHRVAGTNSLAATSSALRDDVLRLQDQAAGRVSALFGHFTVDEATFSSGRRSSEMLMSTSVLEASIPTALVDEGPWVIVRAGHIHRRQMLGVKTGYLGATYKVSFGEANEDKGCEIIDIHEDGTYSGEFRRFDTRELVQVDISADGSLHSEVADRMRKNDILRLVITHEGTDQATAKRVADLRKRGVHVEFRTLPRARKRQVKVAMKMDSDPLTLMETYAKHEILEDDLRKRALKEFADMYEQAGI